MNNGAKIELTSEQGPVGQDTSIESPFDTYVVEFTELTPGFSTMV